VAHGANRARRLGWIIDSAKDAATMSQCSNALANRSRFQDCGAANAAAWKNPIPKSTFHRTNRWLAIFAVSRLGDQRGFAPGAMVAPQIIFI